MLERTYWELRDASSNDDTLMMPRLPAPDATYAFQICVCKLLCTLASQALALGSSTLFPEHTQQYLNDAFFSCV